MAVAAARAHPAFVADHHRHRLIDDFDFGNGFFLGLYQSAPCIGKGFGVQLDFLDHQAAQAGWVVQNVFQLFLFIAQFRKLLFDFDRLQARQLAQANFQNVFGLALGQTKTFHQSAARLVRLADDGNHFVDIEQHQLPPLQDMDAVQHLAKAVARAPLHRGLAKRNPLGQHLAERLLRRPSVQPHHGQVDGGRALQTGVRKQGSN